MPIIQDALYVMPFGKYMGKTLGEVYEENPSYLKWWHQNVDGMSLTPQLYEQVLAKMKADSDAKFVAKQAQKQEKISTYKMVYGGDLADELKKLDDFKKDL